MVVGCCRTPLAGAVSTVSTVSVRLCCQMYRGFWILLRYSESCRIELYTAGISPMIKDISPKFGDISPMGRPTEDPPQAWSQGVARSTSRPLLNWVEKRIAYRGAIRRQTRGSSRTNIGEIHQEEVLGCLTDWFQL